MLLLLTVYLYSPGLDSLFFLDDFYNLFELSEIEKKGFFYYIFSGFSGPSGRPLSLFTFALQYPAWPSDPAAFKAVNLAIHCVNGVLVWLISLRLIAPLEKDRVWRRVFALLTTAVWLLHPMQLSTVLYVVQRMTLLSALFTLTGLWAYLRFRDGIAGRHDPRAYLKFMAPLAISLILAILSKENGILLLLYIIVIEKTLFSNSAGLKNGFLLALSLPLLALLVYLLADLGHIMAGYHTRPFSMFERLLTQPFVLLVYLKHILLPVYGSFGLFHDDFPISAGLLTPPYTLVSIAALILVFLAGLRLRRSAPVFSFAALWFLAGHALEASFVNLELYFEHRNYLPSLGILFGVNYLLLKFIKTRQYRLSAGLAGLAFYTLVMAAFYLELTLWPQPNVQALEWARNNPTSERALTNLADKYSSDGQYEQTIAIYTRLEKLKPDAIYPAIVKLRIEACVTETGAAAGAWDAVLARAKQGRADSFLIVTALDGFIGDILNENCGPGDHENMQKLLSNMIANNNYSFIRDHLYEFSATILVYNGDYERALDYVNTALAAGGGPSHYIYKIRLLRLMDRADEVEKVKKEFREKIRGRPRDALAYSKLLEGL